MIRYEILPEEKRLETRTNDRLDEVLKRLDTTYNNRETFVPPGTVDPESQIVAQLANLAAHLTEEPSTILPEFAGYAALEGFAFALSVGRIVQPPNTKMDINMGRYVSSVPEEGRFQTIRSDAARYLGQHACLRGLVTTYLPKIDPIGQFTESARAITALTFMQIDQSNAESHLQDLQQAFYENFDSAAE